MPRPRVSRDFKAATVTEVQRRLRARDFSPEQYLYAVEGGRVLGYGIVNSNGRVSYPWCLPGFEYAALPLFTAMMEAAGKRGLKKVVAAYRADWPSVHDFFLQLGFVRAREMVNYVSEFLDMPTLSDRASNFVSPLLPTDVPALMTLMPGAIRVDRPEALQEHLFANPYFPSDATFALRDRQGGLKAAGIVVHNQAYADAHAVDAGMPCFRLGAFGTEGMQAKRIKALFSFVAKPDASLPALALDLMSVAAQRLRDYDDITGLAAQVASDVPQLQGFYVHNFKKQGSFPIFEINLPPAA